jgi:hypothetical protein
MEVNIDSVAIITKQRKTEMRALNFMHPITFILLIAALFISVVLEIIITKKIAGKFGIEKEAKWIKAVLISTFVSVIATYIIGHTIGALLSVYILKLYVYIPHTVISHLLMNFVHFSPNILVPILLRVSTYSIASPTWKTLSFKKKLFFCCCSCGLVNLLSILLAYFIITQLPYNQDM